LVLVVRAHQDLGQLGLLEVQHLLVGQECHTHQQVGLEALLALMLELGLAALAQMAQTTFHHLEFRLVALQPMVALMEAEVALAIMLQVLLDKQEN
jgi:hypothetical protein